MLVNYVGRVETIGRDVVEINSKILAEMEPFDLRLNRSEEHNLDLSERSIDLIVSRYSADFDMFNYSRDV